MITGMRGQIGSYLYDILKKDCIVFGTTRGKTELPYLHCDLTDRKNVEDVINLVRPDEVYNMAGETNTGNSIEYPIETLESNGKAVMILCQTLKNYSKNTKLFQACSSEIFRGQNSVITPENTFLSPLTPYAIAKCTAYWTVKYYRESFHLPFYNGIIFTTDSPRRKDGFLTKKIVHSIREKKVLKINTLESKRNWLHARDVAEGIVMCMSGKPREYVFSTGKTNTVKDLIEISYKLSGNDVRWEGNMGFSSDGNLLVESLGNPGDEVYGSDPDLNKMGWNPKKTIQDIMGEILNLKTNCP